MPCLFVLNEKQIHNANRIHLKELTITAYCILVYDIPHDE